MVGYNVNVMKLSAKNPNLNPMENAWAVSNRRIHSRPGNPRNVDHLFEISQFEWTAILDNNFTGLLSYMKTRATIMK